MNEAMKFLPTKWLEPLSAKPESGASEAWWYGEEMKITVCIQLDDGGVVSASIPRRMLLAWASAVRQLTRKP